MCICSHPAIRRPPRCCSARSWKATNVTARCVPPPDAVPDARLPAVLHRGAGADGAAGARTRAAQAGAGRGELLFLRTVELALLPAARRQFAADLFRRDRHRRRVIAAHAQADRRHHRGDASAAAVHLQVSRFPGRFREPSAARIRHAISSCRSWRSSCRSASRSSPSTASRYLVDVYRGDVAVCRRLVDILLYLSFFPQLVAGPIVRASFFLPQLARPPAERVPLAGPLLLIIGGLFKKVVIATYLATDLVDPVFFDPSRLTARRPGARGLRLRGADLLRLLGATATWRSASPRYSAIGFRSTSISPTAHRACASSGSAGISRYRRGCATISTSHSAAVAAAAGSPRAT